MRNGKCEMGNKKVCEFFLDHLEDASPVSKYFTNFQTPGGACSAN